MRVRGFLQTLFSIFLVVTVTKLCDVGGGWSYCQILWIGVSRGLLITS
jgi:hypothetical protein